MSTVARCDFPWNHFFQKDVESLFMNAMGSDFASRLNNYAGEVADFLKGIIEEALQRETTSSFLNEAMTLFPAVLRQAITVSIFDTEIHRLLGFHVNQKALEMRLARWRHHTPQGMLWTDSHKMPWRRHTPFHLRETGECRVLTTMPFDEEELAEMKAGIQMVLGVFEEDTGNSHRVDDAREFHH